jgi:hypothetical protein
MHCSEPISPWPKRIACIVAWAVELKAIEYRKKNAS